MKRRVLSLLLALLLLTSISIPAFAAPTDEATLRHTVARVYTGISMSAYSGDTSTSEVFVADTWQPDGCGTGFFIGVEGENPKYMITNEHVVHSYMQQGAGALFSWTSDSGQQYMCRAQIRVYFDKEDYVEAYVVEVGDPDQDRDFAILRLDEPTDKRAALPICIPNQSVSDPNRKVITVGYPGVADSELFKSTSITSEKDSHITSGMVNKIYTESGTGTQILKYDAAINSGNSGGPLVLDNGAAIAVTTWSVDDGNETMYYGVGMETIKPILDKNSVPYTLLDVNLPAPETPEPTPEPEPEPQWKTWLLYGILGAAILGVVIVLIVLLSKKPKPATGGGGTSVIQKTTAKTPRTLIGVEGPLKDKRYTIAAGQSLYIGRDKSKCKVLFAEGTPGVSKIHCKISFDGSKATITDLKSSYGTAVDGKKLVPNTPVTLHRGLTIDVGSEKNRFVLQ